VFPSENPSVSPSSSPTVRHSLGPSLSHSIFPSAQPTNLPSSAPMARPSYIPSTSLNPSNIPTVKPSVRPSFLSSSKPSRSIIPTSLPSAVLSAMPTLLPSKTQYAEVSTGRCADHGFEDILDKSKCLEAAEMLGHNVVWGPHGGYMDVIDGCSTRGPTSQTQLFFNFQGVCDPSIASSFYRGCNCHPQQPCFCSTYAALSGIPSIIPTVSLTYVPSGYPSLNPTVFASGTPSIVPTLVSSDRPSRSMSPSSYRTLMPSLKSSLKQCSVDDACCSLNFKDCDGTFCGSDKDSCESCPQNGDVTWLNCGPRPICIAKNGDCTDTPNACCNPGVCVHVNDQYSQCQAGASPGPSSSPTELSYFDIQSELNGNFCISIAYSDPTDGSNLILRPCHDGDNQLWKFDTQNNAGKGFLRSKLNFKKCIGVGYSSHISDPLIEIQDCISGSSRQTWVFVNGFGSGGMIRSDWNENQAKCISVMDNISNINNFIALRDCNAVDRQYWNTVF